MKKLDRLDRLAIVTIDYEYRPNIGNHHFNEAMARMFRWTHWFHMDSGHFNFEAYVNYFNKCDLIFINRPLRKLLHGSEEGKAYRSLDFRKCNAVVVLFDTDSMVLDLEFRCKAVSRMGVDFLVLGNNDKRVQEHNDKLSDRILCLYLPFGVNTEYFCDRGSPRDLDCGFIGNTKINQYQSRKDMVYFLKNVSPVRFAHRCVYGREYIDYLNRFKIFAVANDTEQGFFMKHLEAMACGCLVVAEHTPLFSRLGFEHKKHLVVWNNHFELENYIALYLANDAHRESMVSLAKAEVAKNHTWDARVHHILKVAGWTG